MGVHVTKPDTNPTIDKNRASADIINAINNDENSPAKGFLDSSGISKALKVGDIMENGAVATAADVSANLRSIGAVVTSYDPNNNPFLRALINRIGLVVITSRMYKNHLAFVKKGMLEFGDTVEELWVAMAEGYQFDPVGAQYTLYKRYLPDVKALFHTLNFTKYYPTTVSNDQLRQAFLSWNGVSDLISRIIEQLYTGLNYDEEQVTKYLIARAALNGNIYAEVIPEITKDNITDIAVTMSTIANNFDYMSDKYNAMGVKTYTDRSSLYILETNEFYSTVNIQQLALAFNMDKAELIGRQIRVDGFGEFDFPRLYKLFEDDPYTTITPFTTEEIAKLKTIKALMFDESFFQIYDSYYNMTDEYNGKGLYWNYFLHTWKIFSLSWFSNAVLFTTTPSSVTSIAVSPQTLTIEKGKSGTFTATVVTVGLASQNVKWSITGNTSTGTQINNGILYVEKDEISTTITVTATALADTTKTATATVTVS